jgi:hypothetical protein
MELIVSVLVLGFFVVVLLAFLVAATYGLYRLCVVVLHHTGRVPAIGQVVSVDRANGVERFKLSVGKLFHWNVSVHPEKGTVAGSIQIGSSKGWLLGGAFVALAAAIVVPKISAVVLPAALVAIAVGLGRKALRRAPQSSPVSARRSP